MPALAPICTISLSTVHLLPRNAGRRYVQFSVLLTLPLSQKPFAATGATVMDVHMSKMRATAPPCRLPVELQRAGMQVREKTVVASLGSVAETWADLSFRAPARTLSWLWG